MIQDKNLMYKKFDEIEQHIIKKTEEYVTEMMREFQINFISKQRVREAIEKRINYCVDWEKDGRCGNNEIEITKIHTSIKILNELLKELGWEK